MNYPRPELLDEAAARGARQVVIEASAGTGKTFTLEHAVVDLLLRGATIGQVLAVTFTERAASELRERVRELLRKILAAGPPAAPPASAWTIDDEARGRLRRALLDFDGAAIFTIHGFCERVLTEHAFLVDRALDQTLTDPRQAFSGGFRHVLRTELATAERAELRAWLDHADVDALRKLLFDVDATRAERVRPETSAGPLREALAALVAAREVGDVGTAVRALQTTSRLHHKTRAAAGKHLQAVAAAAAAWTEGSGALLALSADGGLDAPLAYLVERAVSLVEAVPSVGPVLGHALAVGRWRVPIAPAAAQLFLPRVQARVEGEKRRRGQYDFHDMLTIVRDAVEGPTGPALVAALRRRWVHALIDEFQDTDDAQWATFRRVFGEAPPPHTLWVIGDPKQAIYGFRGADVFTYLRATRELLGAPDPTAPPPVEPLRLVANFRSTPAMVDAFNAVFEVGAGRLPFFGGQIGYPPATCGRPGQFARDAAGRDVAPVHLFHFVRDDDGPFRAAALRELHARRIAQECRRLVDEGLVVGDASESRRVGHGDLFVLTRTTREAHQVAGHLRALGVPFAFYKQEGLLQTVEAEDVHALLAAVAEPHDRARRLRAWTTPFFGLTRGELEGSRDVPGDHPLVARLLRWSRLAERRAWGRLFAALLEESGLVRRELLLRASERELTNYTHLLELLHETAARDRLELHELVRLLGAWIREERLPEGEETNIQRLESDAAAVQLMTMHKAKGLEAEVVFLFGGLSDPRQRQLHLYHDADGPPPDEPGRLPDDAGQVAVYHDPTTLRRVVHVGPPSAEVARRIVEEQEAEERRLVYVAVTRARSRLYLPSFGRHEATDKYGRSVERWDYPYLGGCMAPLAARLFDLMAGDPAGLDARLFEAEVLRPTDGRPGAAGVAPDVAAALRAWSPPDELLRPLETALQEEADARARLRRDPRHAPRVLTSFSSMKRAAEALALAQATTAAPDAAAGVEVEPALASAGPGDDVPPSEDEPPAEPAAGPADELPGGADVGTCLHDLIEGVQLGPLGDAAAWSATPEVRAVARRAAARNGVAPRHVDAIVGLAHRALTTPLTLAGGALLAGGVASLGDGALRELEFTYPIPEAGHPTLLPPPGVALEVGRGWVRGFMDLVFRHDGRGYVADWKSNKLPDYAPGRLREVVDDAYDLQRKVYALALAKLLGVSTPEAHAARFGGVLFLFVRGLGPGATPGVQGDAPGVVFDRPGFEELCRFERELAEFPGYGRELFAPREEG